VLSMSMIGYDIEVVEFMEKDFWDNPIEMQNILTPSDRDMAYQSFLYLHKHSVVKRKVKQIHYHLKKLQYYSQKYLQI